MDGKRNRDDCEGMASNMGAMGGHNWGDTNRGVGIFKVHDVVFIDDLTHWDDAAFRTIGGQ